MVRAKQKLQILEVELLDKKLKWVEISLLEVLQRGKRIEGAYFNIEGKRARQAIRNCGYEVLSVIGESGLSNSAYYPDRFKRIYLEKGTPFFLGFQSLELFPKPVKFIGDATRVDFENIRLKMGQILLTRSGTIGQASYVGRTLDGKVFTDDLIRIRCDNLTNRGFLYAFLRSKPGHYTVITNTYGSVVTHIEPAHLENVPIPNPPEKIKKPIADKIYEAVQLRDEANDLLQNADNLLFEKLKLKRLSDLKPKYLDKAKNKVFSVKLSDSDRRIDGSYHNPLCAEIVKQFKKANVELTTCGDPRVSKNIILPGRFKRYYVDKEYGYPFLSSKNIFQVNPVGMNHLSKAKHKKQVYQISLQENMILVTRSGTVGRVLISPKYFDDSTATEHIIRLIPSNDINPGYIYCFLASDYGHTLLKKFTYGSVVDEIDDKHMANVPFPITKDKSLINNIGNMVLDANKRRNLAWELEKKAITEVEKLVGM